MSGTPLYWCCLSAAAAAARTAALTSSRTHTHLQVLTSDTAVRCPAHHHPRHGQQLLALLPYQLVCLSIERK